MAKLHTLIKTVFMKVIVASSIEIQVRNIYSCKMWNYLALSMLILLQTMNVCITSSVSITDGGPNWTGRMGANWSRRLVVM